MLKSFHLKHLFFVVLLTSPLALSGQNYCQQKGTMPYTLWGTGEAGGLVFYDKGQYSNGWRFMEQTNFEFQSPYAWGCNGTNIWGAVDTAIGAGMSNTLAIAAGCGTNGILADLCLNHSQNGYDDWHMPSSYELYECAWAIQIGPYKMISSTQVNVGAAYHVLSNGTYGWVTGNKVDNTYRTLAVRYMNGDQGTQKSITNFQFGSINKVSTKPSGYSNYFNTDSTSVIKLQEYPLSIRVNTAGIDTLYVSVMVDWNNDGDFSDNNEFYQLGTANNTANGLTSLSPLNITIPDINQHNTASRRMRVIAKKGSYANPCETLFDGEVEDYKLVVNPQIKGRVFNDLLNDCIKNSNEPGVPSKLLLIQPGDIITQSDAQGYWSVSGLPPGNYSVKIDTADIFWTFNCNTVQPFAISNPNVTTLGPDFGLTSNISCTDPEISISGGLFRRCVGTNTIYVSACNQSSATLAIDSSYVDVHLDYRINLSSASIPYTSLGGNIFRFQTGDIYPGQCANFSLAVTFCNGTSISQSLCMEAYLYPVDSCVLDTIPSGGGGGGAGGSGGGIPCTLPWDQSSLSVNGYCQNDSACFVIRNTGDPGDGDMECYSQIRIFVDGVLTVIDSLMIPGGDSLVYCYYANGQTIRLEVDQHPLHPGNSNPNDVVELCGNPNNWTPGFVTSQPQNDADPVVDIFCGTITGSYDPNDKTGFPTGLTNQHFIQPNQQIQYLIRFQNTGNDTAFTVVIRDTLDTDLNIFTVTPGVSSHPNQFRMYGPRVLEWTFNNILLPDSNVNEPGSHGFVTFRVDQVPNLVNGTVITNEADIYFDFNSPITTNTTTHTINDGYVLVSQTEELESFDPNITVYPNPGLGQFTIELDKNYSNEPYQVHDHYGRKLYEGKASGNKILLELDVANGIYFFRIGKSVLKLQVIK